MNAAYDEESSSGQPNPHSAVYTEYDSSLNGSRTGPATTITLSGING